MSSDATRHRLQSVDLDEESLAAASRDQEQERQIAIFDLLEDNHFVPNGGVGGPYDLRLSLIEGRLAFDILGPGYQRRHLLSLSPMRGVVKDYHLICESYFQAIRNATPQRIETLDMGRRALHDEGSRTLQRRLDGKVETDLDTARRLFTPDLRPALARMTETGGNPASAPGAVLFACGLNRIRSPMAAGLMWRLHGEQVFIDSCGLHADPDGLPDPFVVAVMDEVGIDMSGHQPKTFDDLDDDSFDVIISLSPEAHHRAGEFARIKDVKLEYWPTLDPTLTSGSRDQILNAYRAVRDALELRIRERFPPGRTFGG